MLAAIIITACADAWQPRARRGTVGRIDGEEQQVFKAQPWRREPQAIGRDACLLARSLTSHFTGTKRPFSVRGASYVLALSLFSLSHVMSSDGYDDPKFEDRSDFKACLQYFTANTGSCSQNSWTGTYGGTIPTEFGLFTNAINM